MPLDNCSHEAIEIVSALYDLMDMAAHHKDAEDPKVLHAKERIAEAIDGLVRNVQTP
jgi:hypothetical protein